MCGGILAFECDLLPAFRHRQTAFGLIESAGCAREMQMHRAEARLLDIRRILCPVDFSDASRHAWDHAVVIAGWYGASITALHVCNPVFPAEPPISFAELPKTTERLTGADRRELEADLAPWLESACAGGVVADVVFDEGHNPAAPILACATSLPADLIVLGTHGLGGFERFMLGSVTEKVLRKANCPVLTVPPPVVKATKPPFKRLLCPVDFSPSSLAALQFAFSIAKESDAHLTIMHALDWPADDDPALELSASPDVRVQVEQVVKQRLEALIGDDARTWCDPTTIVSHGKPYREILQVAAQQASDLIVIGVRGRGALDQWLFGSTTNQVVRRASCPVLTVKA
jgi:nucleotide-binding universal stress UspA family protein